MMFKRGLAFLMLCLGLGVAQAGEWAPYTDAQFNAFSKDEHTVVLMVHADWCATCKRQQPALESAVMRPEFAQYDVLVVDYDKQTDVMKRFKVTERSTLLVFKAGKEIARATGITDSRSVISLLRAGL